MIYNYHYGLGSIFFMGLTLIFYFSQKRLHNQKDRVYSCMLVLSMIALISDTLAALLDTTACPISLLYLLNILFLVSMQACLPAFLCYALISAGQSRSLSHTHRWLMMIPYLILASLVAISPFMPIGVFRIDEQRHYLSGPAHAVLYVNAAIYLSLTLAVLFDKRRPLQKAKRGMTLLAVSLLAAAMALQILFPKYLLTSSATALSLTAMYYAFQSPSEMIDPLTGAYSRVLLPEILRDRFDTGRAYTLILHSLYSFEEIAQLYGDALSEEMLTAYSALLRRIYKGQLVVYMDTSEFTAVCDGILSDEAIQQYLNQMPPMLKTETDELPLKIGYAAITHAGAAGGSVESDLTTMDFLYQRLRETQSVKLIKADDAFRSECDRRARLESYAEQIMTEGIPELHTQNICDMEDHTLWTKVEMTFHHKAAEDFSAEEIMNAIGRTGAIRAYYIKLFNACAGLEQRRICLPLPPAASIHKNSADRLAQMAETAGLRLENLIFTMSEQTVVNGMPDILKSIQSLTEKGVSLQIDRFAEGYTDLSAFAKAPVHCVELDTALLQECRGDKRHFELLQCIIGIAHDNGKKVICSGADSSADIENAFKAGADGIRKPA